MFKNPAIFIIFFSALLFGGCAKDISPYTYRDATVGEVSQVKRGVIIDARPINVKGESGAGMIAGGAAGAVAGSSIGQGRGSTLAAIATGLAGGLLGKKIDQEINSQTGMEYVVELNSGKIVSVVQGASDLRIGQKVLVMMGPESRVVADHSN